MKKSINGWSFPPGTPVAEAAKAVAAAGFEAFEPTLELDGDQVVSVTLDEAGCRKLGDQIRAAGIEVASLACGLYWTASFTSADPADREKAKQWTVAGLERAKWLGTDALLVVPGMVSHFERPAELVTGYAEAYDLALAALKELAPKAEELGVAIAVENVWNGFLLSPLEMRNLIDEVNSPGVKGYVDVGNIIKFGFPEDWINILGKRVARIHLKDFKAAVGNIDGFCALGDGDVNWPAVMKALKACGYDGPLTYEGPGELNDLCARVTRVMGGAAKGGCGGCCGSCCG